MQLVIQISIAIYSREFTVVAFTVCISFPALIFRIMTQMSRIYYRLIIYTITGNTKYLPWIYQPVLIIVNITWVFYFIIKGNSPLIIVLLTRKESRLCTFHKGRVCLGLAAGIVYSLDPPSGSY